MKNSRTSRRSFIKRTTLSLPLAFLGLGLSTPVFADDDAIRKACQAGTVTRNCSFNSLGMFWQCQGTNGKIGCGNCPSGAEPGCT
jgi:hypothetical protein